MNSLKNIRIAPYKTRKKAQMMNEAFTEPIYADDDDGEGDKSRCQRWLMISLMGVAVIAVHVSVLLLIFLRMQ